MIIMTHEINEFFMNHSLSFMLKMKEDVKLKLFWLIFDYVITHRWHNEKVITFSLLALVLAVKVLAFTIRSSSILGLETPFTDGNHAF